MSILKPDNIKSTYALAIYPHDRFFWARDLVAAFIWNIFFTPLSVVFLGGMQFTADQLLKPAIIFSMLFIAIGPLLLVSALISWYSQRNQSCPILKVIDLGQSGWRKFDGLLYLNPTVESAIKSKNEIVDVNIRLELDREEGRKSPRKETIEYEMKLYQTTVPKSSETVNLKFDWPEVEATVQGEYPITTFNWRVMLDISGRSLRFDLPIEVQAQIKE